MASRNEWMIAFILIAIIIVILIVTGAYYLKISSYSEIPAIQINYTKQQLDYFSEIAFTPPEYGDGGTMIYKWDGDLRFNITGEPEYSDIDAVLSAIDELRGLTGNISLSLNDSDANVIVYVGKEGPILDYLETNDSNLTNGGFFFWTRDDTAVIDRATIAISCDYYSASMRAYNLRYALVYVLGLHGLSSAYNDSIFYLHYTPIAHYSDLDRALVRMLYDDRVKPGMTKEEALAALEADLRH